MLNVDIRPFNLLNIVNENRERLYSGVQQVVTCLTTSVNRFKMLNVFSTHSTRCNIFQPFVEQQMLNDDEPCIINSKNILCTIKGVCQ